jgi:hypothetical protein
LEETTEELRLANQNVDLLQQVSQRSKYYINGLQNELIIVHQLLLVVEDARNLSDVSGHQVFSTKADTLLSISEVGEKVTTLNKEIFQAAATLGIARHSSKKHPSTPNTSATSASSQLSSINCKALLHVSTSFAEDHQKWSR